MCIIKKWGLFGDLRGTQLLDAEGSEPLAHVDAVLEGLALDDTGAETTAEGITVWWLDFDSRDLGCIGGW